MIYRLVSRAAAPFAPILLARRAKRGKEHRQRLSERRGESRIARPDGPLIWLHGASVGELASVLPLIERFARAGIPILVTTGTVTSGDLAEQRLPRGVVHQFIPVDVPRFVGRFLDHWRPDLALFVESDLWPNMIIEASESRRAHGPGQRLDCRKIRSDAGSAFRTPSRIFYSGSISA
jgi:3-deoxy-D-manno-octulosonic-acid transferase